MEYAAHAWSDGETISAERLNAIESQLEALTKAVAEATEDLATLKKARTTRSRKSAKAAE